MASNFLRVDRETLYLMPPSVQEWLPEGHLARFVVEMVEALELGELEGSYRGSGKAAYPPSVLLSLLFYGYATGVFSSRKLEEATYDSVAFRYIAGNRHPDHDTIAHFRRRFLKELEGLFVQLLVLAKETGFLKLGHVSLDGTKIKANASKHKALSWGYAERLEGQLRGEVEELFKLAEQADTEEGAQVDIPEELSRRQDRLAKIRQAKAKIEQRARERFEAEQAEYEERLKRRKEKEEETGKKPGGRPPEPPQAGPRDKDQVNLTDEESRIMPSAGGFEQAYNAQAAVDNDSHLIVTSHVTDACNDKEQVREVLERLEAVADDIGKPQGLLADSGYHSAANVELCEQHPLTPYIAAGRQGHHPPLTERLTQPPPCPADADAATRAEHRLRTPQGKAVYGKRKATVETVFGVIKEVMGFRRFRLRGLSAVNGEWTLVSLAWNLKRMHALASGTHGPKPPLSGSSRPVMPLNHRPGSLHSSTVHCFRRRFRLLSAPLPSLLTFFALAPMLNPTDS